jgi:hypothetical protein
MKPPLIHLKDKYGTDYGKRPIKSITWDNKGNIQAITVIMTGEMTMRPTNEPNSFANGHDYIFGTLIF